MRKGIKPKKLTQHDENFKNGFIVILKNDLKVIKLRELFERIRLKRIK